MKRKRKLVSFLLLSYRCIVTINVLWLFLTVPWIGLQRVIVVFPDHTHLLLEMCCFNEDITFVYGPGHEKTCLWGFVNIKGTD